MGDYSISRHLSAEFVHDWQQANPNGQVVRLDLAATDIAPITGEWIAAAYTPKESRSEAQRAALITSDKFIEQLRSADEYVLGVPMHNFTVPATLRLWIDLVVRTGETFAYGEDGPKGLLEGKKATLIVASGGVYGEGAITASYNFTDPYLRTIFGFIGVQDVRLIAAGGAAGIMSGDVERDAFLQPSVEAIHQLFKAA